MYFTGFLLRNLKQHINNNIKLSFYHYPSGKASCPIISQKLSHSHYSVDVNYFLMKILSLLRQIIINY